MGQAHNSLEAFDMDDESANEIIVLYGFYFFSL